MENIKLPDGWKFKTIGECFNIIKGKKVEPVEYGNDAIRYIQIGDLRNDNNIKYCLNNNKYVIARKEDIIIAWDGANAGTIGYGLTGAIGSTLAVLNSVVNEIDTNYVGVFLKSKFRYLRDRCTGATIPHIQRKVLEDLIIPIPPLETQKKIVEVLEKAEKVLEKRKEANGLLDELIKSKFIEMFGNLTENKLGWVKCKLGDIAEAIDPQPSHRTPPIFKDGIPYVGIAECNYKTMKIDFNKARKVGQYVLDEHRERYSVSEGDFIIGKIGTIGKPFFVPLIQNYTLSANTVLIKPNTLKIVPFYLFTLFQSEYVERQLLAEKKSTSQPAFGIQKVRNIDILNPSLELQNQFADFVNQVDKLKFEMQNSLEEMENNFNSLMQRAFKGELFN